MINFDMILKSCKVTMTCVRAIPSFLIRPYQFDLLIHEYGDSIFSKKDL